METEFAVIGGGVVGLSLAYGLLKKGRSVVVFDEGDGAFRASRGNFGLVWTQGKGLTVPAYAQWSRRSAAAYAGFAEELAFLGDQDLSLVQDGGYVMHMSEESLNEDCARYEQLRKHLDEDYPFEIMDHGELKREEPYIGDKVVGALYCPEDGHLNPLHLLKALATAVPRLGGTVINNSKIIEVLPGNTGYRLKSFTGHEHAAEKVVLSAGLGAAELGPKLGFGTNIEPQQGQILITEKIPKLINRPNVEVRQVNEGGVQIGASKADVGLNDNEDVRTVAALAKHAIDMYPKLAKVKLVRSWAALRIMSPDGLPIYQESPKYPGVHFVTCHSGITLAAVHAEVLPDWIIGDSAPDLSTFSEARFEA